ncbi:hypothetical protein NECID01_1013 [Nematocida sp. AWRm77]|nr:hypothetical protein NECID01_1013 [Nematocida sp. AWRm77]
MDGSYNGFVFTCKEEPSMKRGLSVDRKSLGNDFSPVFSFSVQKRKGKGKLQKAQADSLSAAPSQRRSRSCAPKQTQSRAKKQPLKKPTKKSVAEVSAVSAVEEEQVQVQKGAQTKKQGKGKEEESSIVPLFDFTTAKDRKTVTASKGKSAPAEEELLAEEEVPSKEEASAKEMLEKVSLQPININEHAATETETEQTVSANVSVRCTTPGPTVDDDDDAPAVDSATLHNSSVDIDIPVPCVLSTPIRTNRTKTLDLEFMSSRKRRCSIFKTRRESLFGYDQIDNGSILPTDFYKHSNESQEPKARIKQVLIWIIKYISNGHMGIEGISQDRLQSICDAFIKKVPFLEYPSEKKQDKKEEDGSAEGTECSTSALLSSLHADSSRYALEIEKWKNMYSSVLRTYTLSVPLRTEKETHRRLSLSIQRHSLSGTGMVSFDATLIPHSPNEVLLTVQRRIEDLHTVLNSSRYFMFLAAEYTKKVCSSLVSASCSVDKTKANALLQMLCRSGKSSFALLPSEQAGVQ